MRYMWHIDKIYFCLEGQSIQYYVCNMTLFKWQPRLCLEACIREVCCLLALTYELTYPTKKRFGRFKSHNLGGKLTLPLRKIKMFWNIASTEHYFDKTIISFALMIGLYNSQNNQLSKLGNSYWKTLYMSTSKRL